MIVVSDTSPILNLAAVSRLHLLEDLYREIVIPPTVAQELEWNGIPLKGSSIRVVQADNQTEVEVLRRSLDPGEAEAIVVADCRSRVFSDCSAKPKREVDLPLSTWTI